MFGLFSGKKLIDSIVGEFERIADRLAQAIEYCRKEIYANDEKIQKLNMANEDLIDAIGRAENFSNNLNKLIGRN